jgi:hypothetical protein
MVFARPTLRLQPRRLTIATAAVGCKPMLASPVLRRSRAAFHLRRHPPGVGANLPTSELFFFSRALVVENVSDARCRAGSSWR